MCNIQMTGYYSRRWLYGRPKHDHSTLTSDALDASDAVFRRTQQKQQGANDR